MNLQVNALLNIIKTISNILFPLVTFPYISRVLMPENIGKLNFSNAYVSYFTLIATLGITTYAVRECAKVRNNKEELGLIASELFTINMLTTIVSYALLGISLYFFKTLNNYRVLILTYSVMIFFNTIGTEWLNMAMEDFKYITLRALAFQILSLVLMFTFVKEPDDYIIYAAIFVISSSGWNLFNVFYRRKFCLLGFRLNNNIKRHFKPILYLFVMLLSQSVLTSADITMLGLMKGDYAVGIYSTAYKIMNLISQICSSIVFVLIPRLAFLFSIDDYQRINIVLRKVFGFFLLIGLPLYFGGTVLAREIILIIAGDRFIDSILALQLLLVAFLFSLYGGSFLGNIVLLSSGKEKEYMRICIIAAIANVVFNYLTIPFFGVYAAASCTALVSLLIMLMLVFNVDKRITITGIWPLIKGPLLGSVLLCIYCMIIKTMFLSTQCILILSVFGSMTIYYITNLYMGNELLQEFSELIMNKIKSRKSDFR